MTRRCEQAFERFLDSTWPEWRDQHQKEADLYTWLRATFAAGWQERERLALRNAYAHHRRPFRRATG
jgi:hypothetical protein